MSIQKAWTVAILGAAALCFAGPAKAAEVVYEININTTEIVGTTGYLDFQFNPGFPPPIDPAFAKLFDFSTDGTLTAPAGDIGDVSGALPGAVRIDNTDVTNDHAEGFTFGSFFDIFVELEIPTISGSAGGGSSFLLGLEDSSFNPIVTSGPLVEIDLDAAGNPTVTNNSPNAEAAIAAVPEPGALALLILGVSAIILRKNQRA